MRRDILYRINEMADALSTEAVTLFADRAEDIVNRQLNRELDREIAQEYLSDEHNATTELLDALRAYTQRINRYAKVYQYEEDKVEEPLQNPYASKPERWTCRWCGTINPGDEHICSGCGANSRRLSNPYATNPYR